MPSTCLMYKKAEQAFTSPSEEVCVEDPWPPFLTKGRLQEVHPTMYCSGHSTDLGAILSGFKTQAPPSHLVGFMTLGKSPNLSVSKALARLEDNSVKAHLFSSSRLLGSLGMLLVSGRNTCSRGFERLFHLFLKIFTPLLSRPIS